MNWTSSFLTDILHLCNDMSPYVLLGFLISGILHEFVPRSFYTRYLSGNNFRSILLSALFGTPLPLCSCGVIPTAMGLRREGASRGSTISFLIATPQTGIDSIIATYAMLGLPMAFVRPIAAFLTALFGGMLVSRLVPEEAGTSENVQQAHAEDGHPHHRPLLHRIGAALRYGMVDMVADIGKWLVIGLLIAGIITAIVPDSIFSTFKDNSLLSMLVVLLFTIPMYLCATGSIPIAVALMLKGLSPGAALVLLMAGPASNMGSILVIRKVLGNKTMLIYLLSILIGTFAFGFCIDTFFPREWFTQHIGTLSHCDHHEHFWFPTLCTIVLALLLVYNFIIIKVRGKHHSCHCEHCSCNTNNESAQILIISGMNCNHCAANAQKALSSVQGVVRSEVSLETSQAHIFGTSYDKAEVIRAVESLGFKAEWKENQ